MKRVFIFTIIVAIFCFYFWPNRNGHGLASLGEVTIAELVSHPDDYKGRKVTVRGTVSERVSILGAGALQLSQGDRYSIAVFGLINAPPVGSEATVSGLFNMAFSIGNNQLPVVYVNDSR